MLLLTATHVLVAYTLLGVAALALLLFGAAIAATWRHTRRTPKHTESVLPPVSMLKPLKGLEDELEQNLESFFLQKYPSPLEIVFAVTDRLDPALAVAKKVAARFPRVPVHFVLSDDGFGLNHTVSKLAGALAAARYDVVHQSDANVRVPNDYLARIVSEFVAEDASVLTSVVIGVGEKSLGAALENIQLSAFIGPAMCLALEAAKVTCVCGKSMLLRRSELDRDLGGLASVRDVLCEDFVMGERFKALGRKVVLSPTPVWNVNIDCGPDRFLMRHSRWLKMRITLHIPGFIADLGSNPVALSALAMVTSAFDPFVCAVAGAFIVLKAFADRMAIRLTREPVALRYAWLSVVKDLMLLPLWVNAIFSRTVVWRGRKLRFGKNTQLIPLRPTEAELARADLVELEAELEPVDIRRAA